MKNVNKILGQKSVRITPMRQLVLEYFIQEDSILGLSELEKVFPKSDRVTIYRTLKTFEEKGIIHSIENGNKEVKYGLCSEYCVPEYHLDQHPHFYCSKCQQITCLENIIIPAVELPDRFTADDISMSIKGVCPECQI